MTGRRVDIQAICRLCISDRYDNLRSAFDESLISASLLQKIGLLLQIQISKHDRISTMVCNDCITKLDSWFAYKKQCHRNQTKLLEWLNISNETSKDSGADTIIPMTATIKTEPDTDAFPQSILPIKLEINNDEDEQEFSEMNTLTGLNSFALDESEQHLYLDDFAINTLETDDDRTCPDCGRMFGSAQNRRRHQNMLHAKKERRAQMMEIRKPFLSMTKSADAENKPVDHSSQSMELESSIDPKEQNKKDSAVKNTSISNSDTTCGEENVDKGSTGAQPSSNEVPDNISAIVDSSITEAVSSSDKSVDMDVTAAVSDDREAKTTEDKEASTSDKEASTNDNPEEAKPAQSTPEEESQALNKDDEEEKIQFAAGLRLIQKGSPTTDVESLSKIELSYIEKCKAMVSMFHTLHCACHNVQHKSLRSLLSHLRETRIWFPLFTCYNCMVSLTGRSTFTKHYSHCSRPKLETLIKLSGTRKRSETKSRLYQNFKCNRCNFLFSFHQDYCKHVDEDHPDVSPPYFCSCRYVFDSLEEYRSHCYTSCMVSYYCDICFITTPTIEEFVKHAEELHDSSEGFVLLQENTYIPRSVPVRHKEADDEANVVEGKRERKRASKEPIMVQIYDREIPPDVRHIPTKVIKKLIHSAPTTTGDSWYKSPTNCPVCGKQYSSVNNMMRHYRSHLERKEVDIPKFDSEPGAENEDLYTCPDCGGVYPASKWETHLEEKHPAKTCSECDKEFQFQSELDQHRSVHLNIKVFRDSKTHSYTTAMAQESDTLLVMCEICDTMFGSKQELKTHKIIEHNVGGTDSQMAVDEEEEEEEGRSVVSITSNNSSAEKPLCELCNREFASNKTLKEHVLHKHGASYLKKSEYPKKCEYCDKVCTTGAGFSTHMQMHERMNTSQEDRSKVGFPKKCEYCDKICTTGASYYLHTQMHERVSLGDLKKISKKEKEEESYHTCKRCFKVFGTKCKLKEHLKCHGITSKPSAKKVKKEPEEEAAKNMATLRNEADESEDVQDFTPGVIYACDICENTFSTIPELRSHKDIHSKPNSNKTGVSCKYCKVAFESVNDLTKHMHLEHGESAKPKIATKEIRKEKNMSTDPNKPFKCAVCNKAFATHSALTTHTGWHKRQKSADSTENTPQATAAAKVAKREKVIRKLAEASTSKQEPVDVPEFQCTTCFMELPNETAMQIHMLEKHGSFDADMLIPRCDICSQDFATQEEYEMHKRFHDFLERQKKHEEMKREQKIQTPVIQSVRTFKEEPTETTRIRFPCSWCKSVFSRQDTLNTHIRNHHKEHVKTEFECDQCDRVFDKQSSLTLHSKRHQRESSVTPAAQGNASGHVKVGPAGKIYICSLCNMGFNYPKDLRMHTINDHPF